MKHPLVQSLSIALAVLTLAAPRACATPINIQFEGLVDTVREWPAVQIGSTFSVSLAYDMALTQGQNGFGLFTVPATCRVEVDGQWIFDFADRTSVYSLNESDPLHMESFVSVGPSVIGALTYNFFSVNFGGEGGGSFNAHIPDQIGVGRTGFGGRITNVPDAGASVLLLGLALAGCATFRRLLPLGQEMETT